MGCFKISEKKSRKKTSKKSSRSSGVKKKGKKTFSLDNFLMPAKKEEKHEQEQTIKDKEVKQKVRTQEMAKEKITEKTKEKGKEKEEEKGKDTLKGDVKKGAIEKEGASIRTDAMPLQETAHLEKTHKKANIKAPLKEEEIVSKSMEKKVERAPLLFSLKYAPQDLNQIVGRAEIIDQLKKIIDSKNMPHLLFNGPNGNGKMTAALNFAKALLGDSFYANCKVVYADDPLTKEERDQVRRASYISTSKLGSSAGSSFTWPAFIFSRIKGFLELKPIGEYPYKILIIRNFHLLENEQQGFRRLMEKYSATCRMILLTEHISSIIDPILSRCRIFFFGEIPYNDFEAFIKDVIQKENIVMKNSVIKGLYQATHGKIGKALDTIQIAYFIAQSKRKLIEGKSKTDKEDIKSPDRVQGKSVEPPIELSHLDIYLASKDDFTQNVNNLLRYILLKDIEKAESMLTTLLKGGHSYQDIISTISEEVFKFPINDSIKSGILNEIAEIDFNAIDGNDVSIQLSNLI
ncbi:MAG: hypothetical protein ACTSVC_02190, partial [Promethearchaeota archaeon]